jgi:hypothetical protein
VTLLYFWKRDSFVIHCFFYTYAACVTVSRYRMTGEANRLQNVSLFFVGISVFQMYSTGSTELLLRTHYWRIHVLFVRKSPNDPQREGREEKRNRSANFPRTAPQAPLRQSKKPEKKTCRNLTCPAGRRATVSSDPSREGQGKPM